MKSYEFHQNNSGGNWQENMAEVVVIEANSAQEANDKLVALGGYFDGVENGYDCECCGDRWYRAED